MSITQYRSNMCILTLRLSLIHNCYLILTSIVLDGGRSATSSSRQPGASTIYMTKVIKQARFEAWTSGKIDAFHISVLKPDDLLAGC